jgi:hypothetical protein
MSYYAKSPRFSIPLKIAKLMRYDARIQDHK